MSTVSGLGLVAVSLRGAALVALDEGRLDWRVTDAQGRPANGGTAEPLAVGRWSHAIAAPVVCSSGWHTTSEPWRWRGLRVWLVECDQPTDRAIDKRASVRIRPLAEVDPHRCIDVGVRVAAMRPYLSETDLSGADLRGADLHGADLHGANLRGANLREADLRAAWGRDDWADLIVRGATR
jgi:hypothetical protein